MNLFLFGFLWLMAGRTAQPPKTEFAILVLYREKEFNLGRSRALAFTINDKEQVKLSPNRYAQVPVTPGRVKIQFENDYFAHGKTLWLTMQSGRTYYVKVAIDVDFMRSTLLMAPVGREEALLELQRMKPQQ